ncbi:hypothetical protein [Acholeplasma granularum]|uniref:hypothetical protein n=1 Tax=Acholeplasma granularum TaxID=264635 RepID=UPI0004726F78|nr:hypothetical protein [Acholeplasma granularum]
MKIKLKGVYKYTYKCIKKELRRIVKNNKLYKQSTEDLKDMFINMQANNLEITPELIDTSNYAKSIADSLILKKYPNLIRYSLILSSFIMSIILIFFITALILNIQTFIERPLISMNDMIIEWDEIPNADKYYVVVNGTDIHETKDTHFEFTPLRYGVNEVYVYAENNTRFFVRSKSSNVITYEVKEFIFDGISQINTHQLYQLKINELGEAKFLFRLVYSGNYKFNFNNIVNKDEFVFKILDADNNTYLTPDQYGRYYLENYSNYYIEVSYIANEEIGYYVEPQQVTLNSNITLEPHKNYIYEVNTTFNDYEFITHKDYQKSVQLMHIEDIFGYPGIPPGTLSFQRQIFAVLNQTNAPRSFNLIKKSPKILNLNQTLSVTEINQVEVLKFSRQINWWTLFINYNSSYYDIHFMDNYLRKIDVYKAQSGTNQYITIPLVEKSNITHVFAILVPKDNKSESATTIDVSLIRPSEGNYYPN